MSDAAVGSGLRLFAAAFFTVGWLAVLGIALFGRHLSLESRVVVVIVYGSIATAASSLAWAVAHYLSGAPTERG